jgi:hypothetical protein
MLDGTASVPSRLGGVKIPSLRSPAMTARHASRPSGVGPHASSAVSRWGESGGSALNGCVGDTCSPGTVLAGTGRSVTGNSGSPVSRCSTNSCPVLVAWITAGTSRPPRRMLTSAGGDALS